MLKPGDTFERYTIEATVGEGGMGRVYRAEDARLGRRVALKVISDRIAGPDRAAAAEANARLLREARAAAALDHPNAVAIFDVGELDGEPYIVMELVSGRTLRAAISDASVPAATKIAWLADIARALGAAHRRGLVHRDVKPENVMVREDGVVKVLDFGIARRAGGNVDPNASTLTPAVPTLTLEGAKLGTPVYMAPEQIRGDVLDGRTDQFAWGVLAYELLTGRLPWRGANDALAVVASILTDDVDGAALDAAGVQPELRDVVLRALEKPLDRRFASMDEVTRALEAAARGEAWSARAAEPTSAVRTLPPAAQAEGATAAQRYSTQEVREVLARAIEKQASKQGDAKKLGFEDLLAAAREVGVDDETLREASRALREGALERKPAAPFQDRDAWIRRRRLTFYRHAGVYVIVNAALIVLGMLIGIPLAVTVAPGICWAIGLGIHGLRALTANEDDWAEHNARVQWWLEHENRRHEVALARASRRSNGDPRERRDGGRRRIEVPPATAPARLEVDTASTQADAEAAQAEWGELKQKRG